MSQREGRAAEKRKGLLVVAQCETRVYRLDVRKIGNLVAS